jgi:hypothetical protein
VKPSDSNTSWTDADTASAKQAWAEYQEAHDVSGRIGQAVGIDPRTGEIWFGESAKEIILQRQSQGAVSPLLFLRAGYPYYQRKGGHGGQGRSYFGR